MPKVDALEVILEADRIGRVAMEAHLPTWRDAYKAYSAGGVVNTPRKIQVFQNHVLPIIETIVPRDATALHPQRPFFPISAVQEDQEWRATLKTRAVDAVTNKGKYFPAFVSALRVCELYGTAFVEPKKHYWIENIQNSKPIYDPTGNIIAFEDSSESQLMDGMRFVAHRPWNILCPPNGNDLDDKEWIIIREYVNISEVKKMLEVGGPWKLAKGTDLRNLMGGPSGSGMEDWAQQFRKDKSLFADSAALNIGVLERYYSEDRWIACLNYAAILMDTENQHPNLPRYKKPVAQMKLNPRVGDDEFYGTGWYERTADLGAISDLVMSVKAHSLLINTAKWIITDPRKIDTEKVRRAGYGGVLELTNSVDGNMKTALDVVDMGGEIRGLDEFQQWLEMAKDKRTGTGDIIEGVAPSPRQTGGATMKLAEEAATRIAFGSRYFEASYLPEMADLVTAQAGQMTLVQLADILGWEDAVEVKSADPRDIPGGYQYEFDGSDRVARRTQKFEQLKDSWNYLSQAPSVIGNPEATRVLLRTFLNYVEAIKKPDIDVIAGVAGQMMPGQPQPGAEMMGAPNAAPTAAPAMTPPQQVATPAMNAEMMA